MYQFAYDEIIAESGDVARSQEAQAFDRANALLQKAESADAHSKAGQDALSFNEDLWMILIEDLSHPDNKLTEALRAQLISIGIWVLKEIGRIRAGQSKSFSAIAEINIIIRNGLI
jgi:flagellar protein FlaF